MGSPAGLVGLSSDSIARGLPTGFYYITDTPDGHRLSAP